jgi:hypothetical protein
VRSALAIIVGYIVLAVSAVALDRIVMGAFQLPELFTVGLRTVAHFVAGIAGGYVAALLAGRAENEHGRLLALVVGAIWLISFFFWDGRPGPLWEQILMVVAMMAGAVPGGSIRARHAAAR